MVICIAAENIKVYTVVVVMNPLFTTEPWGRIYLEIGTSKIQCGSSMNKD